MEQQYPAKNTKKAANTRILHLETIPYFERVCTNKQTLNCYENLTPTRGAKSLLFVEISQDVMKNA